MERCLCRWRGATAITYILNEPATLGVTVNIQSDGTNTRSIAIPPAGGAGGNGASRGTNLVIWDGNDFNGNPAAVGIYSFSITAAASGYTVWTQTSIDTNSGQPAYFPLGIAVDNNPNSPYYGRVVMGCALNGGTSTAVPVAAQNCGLYKMNADGSQADEGWYGNANYLEDDYGNPPVAGAMPTPTGGSGYNPRIIKIGDDDRIYWVDATKIAAVISCDILASQYQVVIDEGYEGNLGGPYNYTGNLYFSEYIDGFHNFDVAFLSSTNTNLPPALFIGDNDYPNAGIWMYHMVSDGTNAGNTANNVLAADPNDTEGTQVVQTGYDLNLTASGGMMVDTNLDVFCGEERLNENAVYDAMAFTNWNSGILPPEGGGVNYAVGTYNGEVSWGYGCGVDTTCATDPSFEAVYDTVINSRTNPTVVASPLGEGSQFVAGKTGGGIRLLNAQTGALISVTNGSTVSTYSNLDNGQAYTCAAWDNVGNLYAASSTRNLWRVWSPPGTNTNTTAAVELLSVQPLPLTVSQPVSAFSGDGNGSATPITAAFSGSGPITLQWYYVNSLNNTTNPVIGQVTTTEVTSTLALTNLPGALNGDEFFLVVSNSLEAVTSSVATLTVYTTPQIVTQIAPLIVGGSVGLADSFSVGAVGSLPLTYQWFEDGNPIPGGTNSSYSFNATAGTNTFYVNVANSLDPEGTNSLTATVIGNPTGLPAYEPFTEYASEVTNSSSNAIDLCTSGLTVLSGDMLSTLTWGSLNYSGLGLTTAGSVGIDVLVTNNSSSPFTQSALSPLLPATFPGFPATAINVMAVNPSQPGAAANTVGNSPVLEFAGDFIRPASGTRTLYMSYLISFAQKGQLGTGNDGRYLALLAATNLVEPSTAYPYWGNLFNTFAGSPRYAAHGLLDISTSSAYIGPCDCSIGKDFTTSIFTAPLGNNSPSGAPVFVVGAYTFKAGGQDTNAMWVNPAIGSFGGPNPPASPQNDVMPSGYNMSDVGGICLIDRIGSGGAGGLGTNFVANLLVGTTWSYVTGGPEFTVQPMSAEGSNVTLTAYAVAAGQTVSYQWQKVTGATTNNLTNGIGAAGGAATVSGAANSTLTLTGMSLADAGTYQVVALASSTGFPLTSSAATVIPVVTAPPAPPMFASTPITGAPSAPVLHFSGPAGGTYHVWGTTNLALLPVDTQWTLLGTGTFSGGNDAFACPAGGSGGEFYTITEP